MSNASPVRVTAGVPTGGQFAASGHAEADVVLESPAPPKPRIQTDRETLDNIAAVLASQEWDADLTSWAADEIARTGRPHPGKEILTAEEAEFIEDRGGYVDEAIDERYRQKLDQQRAEAAAAPMRVDPTDTTALLKAHVARAVEAQRAMELTAAKAIAQTVKARWPDGAYLRYAAQYEAHDEDDHYPEAVLDKDFNVIAKRPYLGRAATDASADLDALSAHLTGNSHWGEYRTIGPADPEGHSPLLKIDEAAGINLDEQGAGGAPPAAGPSETLYTGEERKVSGHFGQATFSPRDGQPGTIILIDTSEGRASEPVVVMINDEVIEVAD